MADWPSILASFPEHTKHGPSCSQHSTLKSNFQLIGVSWNHYTTCVARKSLQITYTCPFGLPKCDSFSPRCPPDSELPLAPTITNTCLLASFFTSSSKPSLLLTTGNHGLWFLLWFLTKQLLEAELEFCHVTPASTSPLLEFTLLPLKSFL